MSEVETLLSMTKKACFEADMLPGSNIFDLPNMVRKLRRERNYYKAKAYQMEETLASNNDMESMGWLNRGG